MVALGAVAAVLLFYWWVVAGHVGAPGMSEAMDGNYYNLLIEGFKKGHLWMDVQPDPLLLGSANPFDPAQRPA